jgi:hypothetical protein
VARHLALNLGLHAFAHVVAIRRRVETVGCNLIHHLAGQLQFGLVRLSRGDGHLGQGAHLVGIEQLLHDQPAGARLRARNRSQHHQVQPVVRGVAGDGGAPALAHHLDQ